MFRIPLFLLMIAISIPQGFAGQEVVPPRREKTKMVITIAKNGAISVENRRVRLKELLATLKELGVTKTSKLAVKGEPGTKPKDIERVLETLVDGGLLPKDTID